MQLADHIRKARQIQNKLSHPSCAAVIVAAGSSARMGGTDKILAELGGLPVLSRTLRVFDDHDMIDTIIVVAREEQMPKISRVCSPYHKVRIVVPGGNSRQESVMHGLEAVPEGTELVAVHDGARPLVTPEVITKVILKAAKFGAAAPAIPVKDTIKVSKTGGVDETPDRKTLFAAFKMAFVMTSGETNGLAPSCTATSSVSSGTASRPCITDSCRLFPPGTTMRTL